MSTTRPWRRGSTVTPSTSTRSRWDRRPASSNGGISRDGITTARKDLGGRAKPSEMEMLLSPSRGIEEDDAASLRNPQVQERLREHISEKLKRWRNNYTAKALSADETKRRDEELGIVLLDLRKLREGITSIRRVDAFACEVYEASVLLSLVASNEAQLSSALPHLVTVLHPALASSTTTLSAEIANLSIDDGNRARGLRSAATRSFFLVLHLFHSHLVPAFASSSASSHSSAPSISLFLPTLLSLLSLSRLPPPTSLRPALPSDRRLESENAPRPGLPSTRDPPYVSWLLSLRRAFVENSFSSLSRLLTTHVPAPPPETTAFLSDHLVGSGSPYSTTTLNPLALVLSLSKADSISKWRTRHAQQVVERAYKFPPDRTDQPWVAKWLLFEFEVEVETARDRSNRPASRIGQEGTGRVVHETWDDDSDDERDDDLVRNEAQRRSTEWIKRIKGIA
ncbi:hypothetical protein JCM10212_003220 [Sporobolomyces blumeae]